MLPECAHCTGLKWALSGRLLAVAWHNAKNGGTSKNLVGGCVYDPWAGRTIFAQTLEHHGPAATKMYNLSTYADHMQLVAWAVPPPGPSNLGIETAHFPKLSKGGCFAGLIARGSIAHQDIVSGQRVVILSGLMDSMFLGPVWAPLSRAGRRCMHVPLNLGAVQVRMGENSTSLLWTPDATICLVWYLMITRQTCHWPPGKEGGLHICIGCSGHLMQQAWR